jgi:drug/metabolite transporter (DMT)-like permease
MKNFPYTSGLKPAPAVTTATSTAQGAASGAALAAPERPRARALVGIGALVVYNLLIAGKGVLVGNLLQSVDTMAALFAVFVTAAVFFAAIEFRRLSALLVSIRARPGKVLLLNVASFSVWLTFFVALKNLEPALASAISTASMPLIGTGVLLVRTGKRPLGVDRWTTLGLAVAVAVMATAVLTGRSSLRDVPLAASALGIGMALLTAASIYLYTTTSKAMHDVGWTVTQVMAVRFPLMLVVICPLAGSEALRELMVGTRPLELLAISVCGVIAPLYAFQVAVQRCERQMLSLLLATLPLFFFVVQFADDRLSGSTLSFVGIALGVIVSAAGVAAKLRT